MLALSSPSPAAAVGPVLGRGAFGVVRLGAVSSPHVACPWAAVALKDVRLARGAAACRALAAECEALFAAAAKKIGREGAALWQQWAAFRLRRGDARALYIA